MKIANTQTGSVGARALLAGLAACLVCSVAVGQTPAQKVPPQTGSQPAPSHESARERWERMSPQEREQMQQRFEKFKGMDEAQRREIVERWQHVQRLERGTRESLRGELAKLEPEAQRETLRGYVGRELFERGRAMRDMLPRELREKIEHASPQEVERLLREFKDHIRAEQADHALFELGRELELAPAEVERMRGLPEEQKRAELFVLRRRQIEQRIARDGMPAWLTQQEWGELRALDAPQFCERWFARARQLDFRSTEQRPDQRRGERGEHGSDRPGDRPADRPGDRMGNGGGEPRMGGRGEGDPRGAREGTPEAPRLSPERVREVLEQLRPDPKWFNELWKLSPEERRVARAAIDTRLRERLLEVLGKSPDLATPQEVERLRALQGHEFFEAVHERMRALGIGLPPPRGGPPTPKGMGPPGGGQQPPRPQHEQPPQQPPRDARQR